MDILDKKFQIVSTSFQIFLASYFGELQLLKVLNPFKFIFLIYQG